MSLSAERYWCVQEGDLCGWNGKPAPRRMRQGREGGGRKARNKKREKSTKKTRRWDEGREVERKRNKGAVEGKKGGKEQNTREAKSKDTLVTLRLLLRGAGE